MVSKWLVVIPFAAVVVACSGATDPQSQSEEGLSAPKDPPPDKCNPPSPKDPPPQPPSTCTTDVIGNSSTCDDTSDWKAIALKHCESKKASVRALWPGESCGKDSFRQIKVECCVEAPKPKPNPVCQWDVLGDPKACNSASEWKSIAIATCAKSGGQLTNLALGDVCGKDSYRAVKFECCGASDPKPGDPKDPKPGDPKDPKPGDPKPGDPKPGDPKPGDPNDPKDPPKK